VHAARPQPGTEFAGGDDHRGYALTAPLTATAPGRGGLRKARDACTVRRFAPDEDPADGRLARKGQRWFFDYDDGRRPTTSRSTAWASTASRWANTSPSPTRTAGR
jgi:hypothetical protein